MSPAFRFRPFSLDGASAGNRNTISGSSHQKANFLQFGPFHRSRPSLEAREGMEKNTSLRIGFPVEGYHTPPKRFLKPARQVVLIAGFRGMYLKVITVSSYPRIRWLLPKKHPVSAGFGIVGSHLRMLTVSPGPVSTSRTFRSVRLLPARLVSKV